MIYVLDVNSYRRVNDKLDYERGYLGTIIQDYLHENPLQRIHDLVRDNHFTEGYRDKLYKQNRHEAKINGLRLRLIRYYPITINNLLNELNADSIVKTYYDTILSFRGNSSKVSSTVYNWDLSRYDMNDTSLRFYEMKIFKRMFLEECTISSKSSPIPVNQRHTKCSRITSAPTYCPSLTRGQRCPVWMPCNKILCENLEEETTVCLDRSSGSREYGYYLPSDKADTRTCADETYSLHTKYDYTQLSFPTVCEPCKCICQAREEPYFYSTEITTTNSKENMVVTGVKFEVVNDTLFILIQQGKLLPNGRIDSRTTQWLPPKVGAKEEISVAEMNSFDLTRVMVPYTDVITGIGLTKRSINSRHRIRLIVSSHVYDFKKGVLKGPGDSFLSKRASTEVARAEIISCSDANSKCFIRDKFVGLTVSGGDGGGRRTLPLIDLRKLVPDILTPLTGVGLYLRKHLRVSLVGLEVFTYDVKPLLYYDSDWISFSKS
ncbi:hypothetical protein QAD02_011929 [Eretmocerus hayati]|uniref:Uncharacterized protein n=1 Tax=Eretmocerus hayati TaxID=131215 RepID=A0ACC2NZ50_9HYME|nr:hypothetical protein QAD02_011929 [Eretmocerus hayati]